MSADPAVAPRPRTRPARTPRAPRRVSGPARTPRPQREAISRSAGSVALPGAGAAWIPGLLDVLRRLPDARWLDRLLRGQGWIAIIGAALIGIVAMQVHLLKLNTGIGRAVETTATLERNNADLRAAVSRMSSPERIQQVAGRLGLLMPPAGDVRYLGVRPDVDAQRAVKIMRTPNPPGTFDRLVAPAATAETATPTAPTDPNAPAAQADPAAGTPGAVPGTTPGQTAPAAGATPAQPGATATPGATTPAAAGGTTAAAVTPAGGTTP